MSKYIKIYKKAIPPDLCKALISKFDSDKRTQKDPQPDYSTRTFLYASDKKDWNELLKKVEKIGNGIVAKYFDYLGSPIDEWSNDGFVIAKYKKGDTCILHEDGQAEESPLRYATLLFYLNTVDGGETVFPMQNQKVSPVEGSAVMFPCMLTHPHEALSPKNGNRYILQTWIVNPHMFVVSG